PLDRRASPITFGRQYLHRAIGGAVRSFGGLELGHGGLDRDALDTIAQVGGAPGEHARGLQIGRQIGELKLNRLEFAERLAEHFALARIRQSLIERRLADAERLRRNRDASAFERAHRKTEAAAELADDRAAVDAHVGELQILATQSANAE